MRLDRDTVAKRAQFIRDAIRQNPKLTGDDLQELLFQHFRHRMHPTRMYALKKQALQALDLPQELK